ncbi:DNA-directed RNA polymerase [Coemansia sp. S142-1]|nr:DNA-directed RNA polymerase [Coemansia sp. S142-1]
MTLSAIECKKAGLVFASVHDSYWTHACDVDTMNNIIRDQFVQLHRRPIMEDLKAEFEDRYKDHMMPVIGWEYVSKDNFIDGGKLKLNKARVTKKAERIQKEKEVEMELAMRHLEACGEGEAEGEADKETEDAYATVQAHQARKEAATAEKERVLRAAENLTASLEVVDLRSIELIDPKLDLPGALRQVDLILYTLSFNQKEYAEQVTELRKEYKTRIRLAKVSKVAKVSKKKSRTKTKVVVPAATSASTEVAEGATQATTAAAVAADAVPEQDSAAAALVAESIMQLEKELDAKIAELDQKYVLEYSMPPIILDHRMSTELIKDTNDMIKRGELAGRLVKRVSWVGIEFDPLPAPGDFDIGEVMKSPYFFS